MVFGAFCTYSHQRKWPHLAAVDSVKVQRQKAVIPRDSERDEAHTRSRYTHYIRRKEEKIGPRKAGGKDKRAPQRSLLEQTRKD